MSAQHIGIFGGAFDPPHLGHSQVARVVLQQGSVDEVWFVPVFTHPWAARLNKQLSAYEDRLAMLNLILEKNQKVAEFKDISYTYDTLEFFSKHNPQHTFSWIMGSEYLLKFEDFLKGHPKLLDYHFFVYPRAGFALNPLYNNMTALVDMPEVEISSTQVRAAVAEGQSIENLVKPEVGEYITSNELYFH